MSFFLRVSLSLSVSFSFTIFVPDIYFAFFRIHCCSNFYGILFQKYYCKQFLITNSLKFLFTFSIRSSIESKKIVTTFYFCSTGKILDESSKQEEKPAEEIRYVPCVCHVAYSCISVVCVKVQYTTK